jgi:YD repeat-containing protein
MSPYCVRTAEVDRLGFATHWAYDAGGSLLSLTDAEAQTTSYTYNDAGQRITEQYPDHIAGAVIGDAGYGIITFAYDALGRRTVKEDQQGDTTSYNFDMSGRMLTRVYVGHPTSPLAGQTDTDTDTDTFTYDRNGNMLSGIKGRYNNTVTFSYDDRGQQTQETLTTHGQTYTVGYQKNELGQTTQLQYPDGSLVDRAYTDRGQLLSVDYSPAGAAASTDVADFVYDAGGRETTRNLGNGLTTTRNDFADNQIQSIATPSVETLTYTYDPNKNPTSETRSGVMAPYSWSTGPTGFDDEDRLTNWSRTNGDSQTWNLSPVHDWTSTTINGQLQTRSHGPAHEILTVSNTQASSGDTLVRYDAKGNVIVDESGRQLGWSNSNCLETINSFDFQQICEYEGERKGDAAHLSAPALNGTKREAK